MTVTAEALEYVQLNALGATEGVLDLNDGTHFTLKAATFKVIAPVKQPIIAQNQRRWGGGRQVAETTENGALEWTVMVAGTEEAQCLKKVEELLSALETNPFPLMLLWQPPGALTATTLYEVRGTGTWTPEYEWAQFAGAYILPFQVHVPVAPLAETRAETIYEESGLILPATVSLPLIRGDAPAKVEVSIQTGEEANRSFITGAAQPADVAVNSTHVYWTNKETGYIGRATLAGGTVEESWLHVEGTPNGLALDTEHIYWTDTTAGHVGRATLAGGSIEKSWITGANDPYAVAVNSEHVYWTNLHGDSIGRATLAGGSVNQNFITGISPHGIALDSEHLYWSSSAFIERAPLSGSPVETIVPSGPLEPRGVSVAGEFVYWADSATGAIGRARIFGTEIRPSWLPGEGQPSGVAVNSEFVYIAEPTFNAVARGGLEFNPTIWALLGWTPKPDTGLARAPFGLFSATEAASYGGVNLEAPAGAFGGKALAATTGYWWAFWEVDPSTMTPDSFSGEVAVEVWARMLVTSGLDIISNPGLTLSAQPQDGVGYGAPRFTDEWGAGGRPLTVNEGGGNLWRMTRLGTLHLLVNPLAPRVWKIMLEGTSRVEGVWGVNYLLMVPSTQRACSPSSKVNNSSYPPFIANVGPTVKTVRHDLSAVIAKGSVFLTGALTNKSIAIELASSKGLEVGMAVEGEGVPRGATITEVEAGGKLIEISQEAEETATRTLKFSKYGHPDHGLGGQLLELPPGETDLLVKLSSLVPDDPTLNAFSEQTQHEASVKVTVVARYNLANTE